MPFSDDLGKVTVQSLSLLQQELKVVVSLLLMETPETENTGSLKINTCNMWSVKIIFRVFKIKFSFKKYLQVTKFRTDGIFWQNIK